MSFLVPLQPIYLVGPSIALPERRLSNQDFVKWMGVTSAIETRSAWIEQTTGIQFRHWVDESQSCSDLAVMAAENLFVQFPNCSPRVKQILLATISGDFVSPPTSPIVQQKLNLQNVGSVDIGAACAGFVSGLHVASALAFATQEAQLLIAADIRSKFLDPADIRVASLFGDGGSAALVDVHPQDAKFRVLATHLLTMGSVADAVAVPAGGSKLPGSRCETPTDHFIQMKQAPDLFIKAVQGMVEMSRVILERTHHQINDIDWVIPHQGNIHLGRQVATSLEIPREKLVETVQWHGNTSGSTVGIALSDLERRGMIQAGQKILLTSAGGGGLGASALLEVL